MQSDSIAQDIPDPDTAGRGAGMRKKFISQWDLVVFDLQIRRKCNRSDVMNSSPNSPAEKQEGI